MPLSLMAPSDKFRRTRRIGGFCKLMDMLNCEGDVRDLVRELVDVESVSGGEGPLADMVEQALNRYPHLDTTRLGNVVVARTHFSAPVRVVVAGHLDTVPVAGNLPSRLEAIDGRQALVGRGACDMKGGVAIQLSLAASLVEAKKDVTWVFYDNEEVEASKNGLGHVAASNPDMLRADMAILMEPSNSMVEAGCQGSLRVNLRTHGVAAHAARSWTGHNAIHDMAGALRILNDYQAQQVLVDGLVYREGLNAVGISGGIASNVIPDTCDMMVNYRFAPDKTLDQALTIVREIFSGYDMEVRDAAPAAPPGLSSPLVASFVQRMGHVGPKYGWTDVARFHQLGVPALNFGPGDPECAHTDHELVYLDDVADCRTRLSDWLASE